MGRYSVSVLGHIFLVFSQAVGFVLFMCRLVDLLIQNASVSSVSSKLATVQN
jgi:hypothetical protein